MVCWNEVITHGTDGKMYLPYPFKKTKGGGLPAKGC
jgi:hypothetical protein